jgi:phytoene/squalene synthetase
VHVVVVVVVAAFVIGSGGKDDEQALLENFYHVTRAFQALDPKFQPVIVDITKRMGEGMCEFINKMRVSTLQEWDTYCYYVAGLVGVGLSKLFTLSGLEGTINASLSFFVLGLVLNVLNQLHVI